ncbi:MAG: hypothetical protein J1E01_04360 [Acetatifactor sp.]|nr:hypothetical protein [Acetatifactor sp.]
MEFLIIEDGVEKTKNLQYFLRHNNINFKHAVAEKEAKDILKKKNLI